MQALLDCRSCSGFIPSGASACPCCGVAVQKAAPPANGLTPLRAAFGAVAAGFMAVTLMACYGLPTCDQSQQTDADGDGFFVGSGGCIPDSEEDCDDTNKDIHPGATDTEGDGVDQNCDGVDGTADTGSNPSGGTGAGGTATSSSGGGGSGTTTTP